MIPNPNNRVVKSGDTVTRDTPVVGVKEYKPATREQILGRDPKRDDVFVGGTGLLAHQPSTQNSQPPK